MKLTLKEMVLSLILLSACGQAIAESDEHGHEESAEATTTIADKIARDHGVISSRVGPATLRRTVKTYGRVVVPSNQISHIRARFEGLITDVSVDVGDFVKSGELLATVEANASLRTYEIRSPIEGMVTQRHANAGELAKDQELLTLVDASKLWVELRVFEGQLADVKANQAVAIYSATQTTASTIQNILPSMDDHPFVVARAQIDNDHGEWSPGMFVEGDVVVELTQIPLAVEVSALQSMDGETGVFLKEDDHYQFQHVSVGRSDGRFAEVLGGLVAGNEYVSGNSYLIKADIEKSSAEHDH